MTKFWTFFLDRHHFTILLTIVLILAGLYSAIAIPKESAPEVQIPLGIVTTILPGASSDDIEKLITDKIEDSVLGIENVSKVTSNSGNSVSVVSVEFNASADIDKSIRLLKDAVENARPELPVDAEDPTVTDVNFADQPIMIASIAGNLAPAELTLLGDEVKKELERITGVSNVALSGVRAREVQVIVSQAKLQQYGLTLSDITIALASAGAGSPLGSITTNGVNYGVRIEASLTNPDAVGSISLRGPGGVPLYIQDVATVQNSVEDPTTLSRVSVYGNPSTPALTLSVFKNRGGNIVDTGNAIKEKLKTLQKTTLAGTSIVISYDAAKDVEHDLTELSRVGIETVVLVLIMLFATLGWRESLAAALSIPLSFLIAFIGISASGNTINFVSLFSLILAIGILVDSGIVVVEAIHTRLVQTGDKRLAALYAIKEYAVPLTAGTFTTIAVFVPLFFLSGVTGKFIASIPFTVIFLLLASIFVALGMIPLFATYIIRPQLSKVELWQEKINDRAKHWYENFLRSLFANKKASNRFIWLMIILFFVALALPIAGAVKVVFFPTGDADLAYIEIETPPSTNLTQTDIATREVEELLYRDTRVESFVTEIGSGSYFGGNASQSQKTANITLNLAEDRTESSAEIVKQLRNGLAKIQSAKITVSEPSDGPPGGTPLSTTFKGDNINDITKATEHAERVLSDIPGTVNVTTSTRNSVPEFVVKIDTARAVELGVSPSTIAQTLRSALFSTKATTLRSGSADIEIRVKLDLNPNWRTSVETTYTTIDAVRELSIPTAKGAVPLASLATIDLELAASTIQHEDGMRVASVSGDVSAGTNALEVMQIFKKEMALYPLPSGVTVVEAGESADVNKSFAEMGIALLAGLALMLAILVLEFNSFRHSLYLLATIPLSLFGVMTGLMIAGKPLSFPAMLGIIALAGVIINHAIILMDSIARIGRENESDSLEDVVIKAASSRFRPIVLTTVVTVVGMIPLSLASALWGPLAFTIMFGLTFAMTLTLILIPLLYYRFPGKKIKERYDSHATTKNIPLTY